MADYVKQNFVDGETLFAAQLNHIEDGISRLDDALLPSGTPVYSDAQQSAMRGSIGAMANTPSGDPLHYLYTSLGAVWGGSQWTLNGVSGLSNEDVRTSYNQTFGLDILLIIDVLAQFKNTVFKVNFPNRLSSSMYYGVVSSFFQFLQWNSKVERYYVYTSHDFPKRVSSIQQMLQGCTNLKEFDLYLDCSRVTNATNAFSGCAKLETVWLKFVNFNTSFEDSPNISKESILYLLQNASPSSNIVVTLNATAYATLSVDADIVSALTSQPLITLASA